MTQNDIFYIYIISCKYALYGVFYIALHCVMNPVSKTIVDMHEGSISVFSEGEGHGSTFTVELPIWCERDCETRSITRTPLRDPSPRLQHTESTDQPGKFDRCRSARDVDGHPVRGVDDKEQQGCSDRVMSYRKGSLSCDSIDLDEVYDTKSDDKGDRVVSCRSLLNMHVLVVDDANTNRKMMVRGIAQKTKGAVAEAEDGHDAVMKVEEAMKQGAPFDLITMDFQMPVMDGPTATSKIRALGYKGMIIGVTGNGMTEDIDHFLSQGADRVLIKPVSVKDIEQALFTISGKVEKI